MYPIVSLSNTTSSHVILILPRPLFFCEMISINLLSFKHSLLFFAYMLMHLESMQYIAQALHFLILSSLYVAVFISNLVWPYIHLILA